MRIPIKIDLRIRRRSISEELIKLFESEFEVYSEKNQEVIETYLYFKSKIDELKNRVTPHYKLGILNSKSSGKTINAKLRLPFKKEIKGKEKVSFINIHVGILSNYKKGLKDSQLRIDAEEKIREYIDKKFPFTFLDADNQQVAILSDGIKKLP
jgi:ribosomal protein S17E